MDDSALLRQYCEEHSEDAFAELVARHINLVYSVATRQLGSLEQAEEITQAVFIIFAQKASGLRHDKAVSSWLFRTTHLVTRNFIRSEMRRHQREQEAYMQSSSNEPELETWQQIAPLLDSAVGALGEKDRRAILLRFYEKKSLSEVGTAMGAGEEAAKKRVSRALEKMRAFFARRGVKSTTTIIGDNISAHSVQAAPAALAKTVVAVAAAKGAGGSISTLTLVKGALKVMAWSNAKTAIAIGVGVLLAAGTAVTTVKEVEAKENYPWQVPTADYSVLYKTPPAIKIVPTRFAQSGGAWSDGNRGAMGIAQPLKEIIEVAYQRNDIHTIVNTELPPGNYDFFAKLIPAQEGNKAMPTDPHWAVELQNEITKQFGIKGSLEMRDTDVLVLRPVDTGVRGFKVSHSMPNGWAISENADGTSFFEQPVGVLTVMLEQHFKLPVVDKTGLTGPFDFAVKWDEPDQKKPNLDGLKQALADQLGLELIPTNMPVEMLVIEKVK